MSTEIARGVALRLPNGEVLIIEDAPWPVASALFGVACERLTDPVKVEEVELLEEGFRLGLGVGGDALQQVLFTPRWFAYYRDRIIQSEGQSFFDGMSDLDAAKMLIVFVAAGNDLVAKITQGRIESGMFDFDDVRRDLPEVFSHPDFKSFFVNSFLEGKAPANKSWKRADSVRGHELYELAVAIQIEDSGLSWNKAMEQAVQRRPDLVPNGWRADPVESLKKAVSRNIEQSRFSLEGWRKHGDK